MKNILQLFKINMEQIWRNQKLIYSMFMIFLVLSLFFSYTLLSMIKKTTFLDNTNSFSARVNSQKQFVENVDNFYQQYSDIISDFYIETNISSPINNSLYAFYYTKQTKKTDVGRWFNEEDFLLNRKVIVVGNSTSSLDNRFHTGETIEINGEEFLIIGETFSGASYIPYNSLTNKEVVSQIFIDLLPTVKKDTMQNIKNDLINTLKVDVYGVYYVEFLHNLVNQIFLIALIVCLANFMLVFNRILEERKDSFDIYKQYGLTSFKCKLYLFFEFSVWLLSSFVVSLIMYLIVRATLSNILPLTSLNFIEFATPLLCYIVLYFSQIIIFVSNSYPDPY